MSTFERYLAAERALNEGLIRLERSMSGDALPPFDPHAKMATMRAFLSDLGHPERGLPCLHVAGTSGKGSVSAAAAGILSRAGLRVGLHVSPYLQAAVEKTWFDGRYVSGDDFADAVEVVLTAAKRYLAPDTPASVHGMASVAVSLLLFQRAKPDIVVFEVGCGGRFDLSAVVETVTAVVTNVGLDHVRTLGPGIEQIAWHKAGVARSGVPLVTGASGVALDVVRAESVLMGAPLTIVERNQDAFAHNLEVAAVAADLAAAAVGRPVDARQDADAARSIVLPGRSEKMPGDGPTVILDGAHNPDKLAAAVEAALAKMGDGEKVCLFGVLGAKVGPTLAAPLAGKFDHFVVTQPSVYGKPESKAADTLRLLGDLGCPVEAISNPDAALNRAVEIAGPNGAVLATGSFYLIGALRERFFAKEQVVLQRTSFPTK